MKKGNNLFAAYFMIIHIASPLLIAISEKFYNLLDFRFHHPRLPPLDPLLRRLTRFEFPRINSDFLIVSYRALRTMSVHEL